MLTVSQKKAVEHISSPLIIVAGPGCGKTTVISNKINYLLDKGHTSESILALTLTQKAAEEMSQKVSLSHNVKFTAKTFHSFGLNLLEEYGSNLSHLPEKFTLLDESLQLLFFFENLDTFKLKSITIKDKLLVAKECMSCVSKLKHFGCSLDKLETLDTNIHTKIDIFSFYSKYEKFKKEENYLDFDDILLLVRKMFDDQDILKKIKKKFSYILVDEFQDTNRVQLDLILKISDSNITIAGDKKQSIYAFRGANDSNLDFFQQQKKNSKVISLNDNFRSTKEIVEHINILTKNIFSSKECLLNNSHLVGNVEFFESENEFCEIGFLAETLQDNLGKGKSIAILTRRKSELKKISEALTLLNIDHSSPGLYSLLDSNLVSYLINLLRFLNNPKEESIILFSLLEDLNIRSETLRTLSRKSSLNERSLYVALKNSKKLSDAKDEDEILRIFVENLSTLLDLKSSKLSLSSFILKVISTFNLYKKALMFSTTFEVEGLNLFLKYCETNFSSSNISELTKLLSIIELGGITFENEGKLTSSIELLTIHNAKGREFDVVFLPFLNEKNFPDAFKRPLFETQYDISKEDFISEEKRIFFVGISRAKEKLYLSYIKKYSQNKVDAKKSRFIDYFNFSAKKYTREFFSNLIKTDAREDALFREINDSLLNKNFTKAKGLIDYLSSLNSSTSTLSSFIHNSDSLSNDVIFQESTYSVSNKIKIDPKKMVYSVSQLKTYEQCPKKYLYQYIYKIPTPSKHYFDFGTSMHSVLEEIQPLAKKLSSKELHLRGLGELSNQWISKSYVSADQEREYYDKGIKIIRSFVEKEKILYSKSNTLSLEKEFWLTIEGKRIMGYIDRVEEVDGGVQILDYKTSNSMEMKSKLKENIQLYVYALALSKEGIKPKSMGLWYLIHDQIDLVEFDEEISQKIKKYLLKIIFQIESGDFIAKPTHFNCTYCDFNKICSSSLIR